MSDCIFCSIVAGEIPSTRVFEDEHAYAFLDIAPFKAGHTLVVAKQHARDILADPAVTASLAPAITAVGELLQARLGAAGLNVLSNVGEVSGQSVFHLHVHVIPRYADDPGFEQLTVRVEGIDVAEVAARLS